MDTDPAAGQTRIAALEKFWRAQDFAMQAIASGQSITFLDAYCLANRDANNEPMPIGQARSELTQMALISGTKLLQSGLPLSEFAPTIVQILPEESAGILTTLNVLYGPAGIITSGATADAANAEMVQAFEALLAISDDPTTPTNEFTIAYGSFMAAHSDELEAYITANPANFDPATIASIEVTSNIAAATTVGEFETDDTGTPIMPTGMSAEIFQAILERFSQFLGELGDSAVNYAVGMEVSEDEYTVDIDEDGTPDLEEANDTAAEADIAEAETVIAEHEAQDAEAAARNTPAPAPVEETPEEAAPEEAAAQAEPLPAPITIEQAAAQPEPVVTTGQPNHSALLDIARIVYPDLPDSRLAPSDILTQRNTPYTNLDGVYFGVLNITQNNLSRREAHDILDGHIAEPRLTAALNWLYSSGDTLSPEAIASAQQFAGITAATPETAPAQEAAIVEIAVAENNEIQIRYEDQLYTATSAFLGTDESPSEAQIHVRDTIQELTNSGLSLEDAITSLSNSGDIQIITHDAEEPAQPTSTPQLQNPTGSYLSPN